MADDLVKRFIKKDGSQRISFYRMEYSENPRYTTDEPLHCEDWSRDYSIMTKQERESKSSNACSLIRYMLSHYGNNKAIINVLKENAKANEHHEGDNAIWYDASRHEWVLGCWIARWKDYDGTIHGGCFSEEVSWSCKLKNLTMWDLESYLSEEMVNEFADAKYFTDGVKMCSYGFGYHGTILFEDSVSIDSEGICWLEKNEFLKYSGNDEKYWKDKTLREIEFLLDKLKAWCDNDVYGFVVEEAKMYHVTKKPNNDEEELIEYDEVEWNETDSCWGFYGELDKMIPYMFEQAGLNKEDFQEEA